MLKRKEETKKYFIFLMVDNHVSKREEEKSESYFALHCYHHVSILEGRHYVEKGEKDMIMNLFMCRKITWSSKRKSEAAVTNPFIWLHNKRRLDFHHFPSFFERDQEPTEKKAKGGEKNNKRKGREKKRKETEKENK